jgi:glycosyltransferase involved in cell wall biosynthesis
MAALTAADGVRVSFNFMVCRAYHEKRTRPLWETTCAMLARDPGHTVTLLGGFDAFDDVPVVRACDADGYQSCHDKVFAVFDRNTGDEADWFVLADDDTWLHPPNLLRMLRDLPQQAPTIFGLLGSVCGPDGREVMHAHGGTGIFLNAAAMRALVRSPAPRVRHTKHSDVSLALWADAHNDSHAPLIEFAPAPGLQPEATPLGRVRLSEAVSIHTKDRASFADLYAAAGLA